MRGDTTRLLFVAAGIAGFVAGPGCLADFDRPDPQPAHQHHDWDGDGFCEAEPCPGGVGSGDCDDEHPGVYPGAPQVCDDALDNDCDGEPDPEEADGDLDGYSLCDGDCDDTDAFLDLEDADGDGDSTCSGDCDDGDALLNTLDADGDGFVTCDGGSNEVDCDDTDAAVYPGAPDLCDDVEDNDCDGVADPQEADDDGDGYSECEDDCDDDDVAVKPGAVEICDGVDNDCDGTVDDGLDQDLDGDGYSVCQGDCDDTDPLLGPAAAELCDGEDNDCDGVTDGAECVDCDTVVPGYYFDIQSAIDSGTPGSGIVVCISPGTYYENLDFGGNTIRLVGTGGAAQTVVDAGGSGTVLRIASGEPAARVEGLTLTHGSNQRAGGVAIDFGAQVEMVGVHITGNTAEYSGGGIDLRGGSNSYLYLAESVIEQNTVTYGVGAVGGGMRIEDGASAELVDVAILDNEAPFAGGGIWTEAGLSAQRLTLSGNTVGDMGGGLYANGGGLHVTDLVLTDNESAHAGGGMYLNNGVSVTLESASVAGNHAGGGGGGVYVLNYSFLLALNSTFAANTAVSGGGAIQLAGNSDAQLDTVIFAGNSSDADGGAMYLGGSSSPILSHVTVVNNHAGINGGGIAAGDIGSEPVLTDVILAGNDAANAGGALSTEGGMTLQYCSLWSNAPQHTWGLSDPVGHDGNVEADPMFLDTSDPDPLLWDLHLGPTSALIDHGHPALADPDTSTGDMGAYSGPRAGSWDRDGDGHPEWWQPGEYDVGVYPGEGWDCDDRDPLITPDNGCS